MERSGVYIPYLEVTDEEDYSQPTEKFFHFEGTQYEHRAHQPIGDINTRKFKQKLKSAIVQK